MWIRKTPFMQFLIGNKKPDDLEGSVVALKTVSIYRELMMLCLISWVVGAILPAEVGYCGTTTTYEGRVIDADTLEPIEGALVVAIWMEWKGGGMLYRERFKDARECLTNKNGEWAFQGPAGGSRGDSDGQILLSFLTGYRLSPPQFYVSKKWYAGVGGTTHRGFRARSYQSARDGIEGIILIKFGDTEEEKRRYRKIDSDLFTVPLVPIDAPEKRLRSLDFDFEYGLDVKLVSRDEVSDEGYMVYGLKKTRNTWEVLSGHPSLPVGACEKLPITCGRYHSGPRPVSDLPTAVNSGKVVEEMTPATPTREFSKPTRQDKRAK